METRDGNERDFASRLEDYRVVAAGAAAKRLIPNGLADQVDDIAAETMVKALAHQSTLRLLGQAALGGWIAQTAGNLAVDLLRRSCYQVTSAGWVEEEHRAGPPDLAASPGSELAREERASLVRQAVEELPEGLRDYMRLRLQELSPTEAGERLGISRGAARMREWYAQKRLREQSGLIRAARRDWTDLPQSRP